MPPLVIPDNRAKAALGASRLLVGTMLAELRQISAMQLLANAGFDFVIIDNEHGAFSIETIADLSRTARILGVTPFVRVPDLAYPYLAQALDGGAQGIMLPRVTGPEQVHAALEIVKYPPLGKRGCAFNRGHTDFRPGPLAENMAKANDETMLLIQVETRGALESLDAIAAIPGVDVLFIGPTDLSIALDVPGQPDSPPMVEAVEQVLAACTRQGIATAIQANDLNYAKHWAARGMQMISYSSETGLLVSAGAAGVQAIRG
jgi:2-dehydro-3-deoxyglucarate aldolase/4-hydroxy-2-oxoheptanedioate aldolase